MKQTTDKFGNSEPAIGMELRCVDQSRIAVKTDSVGYAFYGSESGSIMDNSQTLQLRLNLDRLPSSLCVVFCIAESILLRFCKFILM
jgi:hypothetical protein